MGKPSGSPRTIRGQERWPESEYVEDVSQNIVLVSQSRSSASARRAAQNRRHPPMHAKLLQDLSLEHNRNIGCLTTLTST